MPEALMDSNGECPACDRLWKEPTVGAISQAIRIYRGPELRGFQCPWCGACFSRAGDLVRRPILLDEP